MLYFSALLTPPAAVQASATPPSTPPVRRSGSWRLGTLKNQFRTLIVLAIVLQGLTLLVSYNAISTINTSFVEIISNSAPSIVAALRMGEAIEDADAKAADYQLTTRVAPQNLNERQFGLTGSQTALELRQEAWQTVLEQHKQFDQQLFMARANITYAGEATAIESINISFRNYVGLIYIMKYEIDAGNREAALAAYKNARDILTGSLGNVPLDSNGRGAEEQLKLRNWNGSNFDPNASYLGIEANIQKLYAINKAQLEKARTQAQQNISLYTFLAVSLNLAVVAVLLLIVLRYSLITHRLVNPLYLLALLTALGLSFVLITNLAQAQKDYQNASKDSFISIEAIAKARQFANDGNADESRFLLIPAGSGLDVNNSALTPLVKNAFRDNVLTESWQIKQSLVDQELERAWLNITYSGERVALCKVSDYPDKAVRDKLVQQGYGANCGSNDFALNEYRKLDEPAIRQPFRSGDLTQAIKINTGLSNQRFGQFFSALDELEKINSAEFDKSACSSIGRSYFGTGCSAFGYLPGVQLSVLIALPFMALLTFGGFWLTRLDF